MARQRINRGLVAVSASAIAAVYMTGTGSRRRGDLWVSVDVRGGRLAAVQIIRSTMQYSPET